MLEYKVNVNGLDVTLKAADTAEMLKTVRELSSMMAAVQAESLPVIERPVAGTSLQKETGNAASTLPVSADDLRAMLDSLRGSNTAKMLAVIAAHDGVVTDRQITTELANAGFPTSLGPMFSAVSKACVRHGFFMHQIFERRVRTIARGDHEYTYKMKPALAEAIRSCDGFAPSEPRAAR